jgi:hypothetical protein
VTSSGTEKARAESEEGSEGGLSDDERESSSALRAGATTAEAQATASAATAPLEASSEGDELAQSQRWRSEIWKRTVGRAAAAAGGGGGAADAVEEGEKKKKKRGRGKLRIKAPVGEGKEKKKKTNAIELFSRVLCIDFRASPVHAVAANKERRARKRPVQEERRLRARRRAGGRSMTAEALDRFAVDADARSIHSELSPLSTIALCFFFSFLVSLGRASARPKKSIRSPPEREKGKRSRPRSLFPPRALTLILSTR